MCCRWSILFSWNVQFHLTRLKMVLLASTAILFVQSHAIHCNVFVGTSKCDCILYCYFIFNSFLARDLIIENWPKKSCSFHAELFCDVALITFKSVLPYPIWWLIFSLFEDDFFEILKNCENKMFVIVKYSFICRRNGQSMKCMCSIEYSFKFSLYLKCEWIPKANGRMMCVVQVIWWIVSANRIDVRT